MRTLVLTILLSLLSLNSFAQSRATQLINTIVEKARLFEATEDLDGKKTNEILALLEELDRTLPERSMQERAQNIVGPWRQIFGPYTGTNDGRLQRGMDPRQIYQIVLPEGRFYNITRLGIAGRFVTGVLQGSYTVTDTHVAALFENNGFLTRTPRDTDLFALPELIERGELSPVYLPRNFPPVGELGQLYEVYADQRYRLIIGRSPSFKRTAVYVMEAM